MKHYKITSHSIHHIRSIRSESDNNNLRSIIIMNNNYYLIILYTKVFSAISASLIRISANCTSYRVIWIANITNFLSLKIYHRILNSCKSKYIRFISIIYFYTTQSPLRSKQVDARPIFYKWRLKTVKLKIKYIRRFKIH